MIGHRQLVQVGLEGCLEDRSLPGRVDVKPVLCIDVVPDLLPEILAQVAQERVRAGIPATRASGFDIGIEFVESEDRANPPTV